MIKYSRIILSCFAIITFLLINACRVNNTEIQKFFSKLDNSLSSQEKSNLKSCKNFDEIGAFTREIKDTGNVNKAFDNISPALINSVDSSKDLEKWQVNLVLLNAYQKELNAQEFNLSNLKTDLINYYKEQEEIADKETINYNKELTKNALSAYKQYEIGDTLCLEIPIEKSGNEMMIIFYGEANRHKFVDTLFSKGILINKEIEEVDEKYKLSHDEFWFDVEILEFTKTSDLPLSNKFEIGKNFRLSLFNKYSPLRTCY